MEKIKVQLDKVVINKTARFIKPCLKLYGDEFIDKFKKVFKVAYGLKDMSINNDYDKHIFILINTEKCQNYFISTLDWIREQSYYETDYCFDNIVDGRLHMIVLKLPNVIDLDKFYQGKYSKMYTSDKIFDLLDNTTKSIVTKSNDYKIEFIKKLKAQFHYTFNDLHPEAELELPPNIKIKLDLSEEGEYF